MASWPSVPGGGDVRREIVLRGPDPELIPSEPDGLAEGCPTYQRLPLV